MKTANNNEVQSRVLPMHRETLIQTELGTYFIVNEDLLTGDVASHRISNEQANEFRKLAHGSGTKVERRSVACK